ncbi:MAG: SH3 domain-containing protein [Bauldia sp.]
MGPTPGEPAESDASGSPGPAESESAAFPDLESYVDLVTELEEILRGAAALTETAEDRTPPAPASAGEDIAPAGQREPVEQPAPLPVMVTAPRPVQLRMRARPVSADPSAPAPVRREPVDVDDGDPPPLGSGFWQVEDASWAAAPAWREPRRTRKADLFIIGALVVLIAGGGAYSAIRFGDSEAAVTGDTLPEASRAEAGLGVPFAPIGQNALRRNDPTAPVPSLDAAVAGPEVTPLPVIVEPPVEVTPPVFLADAAAAAPAEAPPAADPAPAPAAGAAVGGPLVPFDPAAPDTGVAVGIVTTVTTWVNMRAGPDNGEPVVMVVAPDTPVAVRACDYWCSVAVDGRNGYIFRDFLVALP